MRRVFVPVVFCGAAGAILLLCLLPLELLTVTAVLPSALVPIFTTSSGASELQSDHNSMASEGGSDQAADRLVASVFEVTHRRNSDDGVMVNIRQEGTGSIFIVSFSRPPQSQEDGAGEAEDGAMVPVSFQTGISLLQRSRSFQLRLTELLSKLPFEAFFLELPPVSAHWLDRPFELAVVDAPALAAVSTADPEPFQEHLDRGAGKLVVTFPNLGGDATLIVPTKLETQAEKEGDKDPFPHLAAFVRYATEEQICALWQTVGKAAENRIAHSKKNPVWISTSGLGVYWTHVRLDSRPKYYTFGPYKVFDPPGV